jgi:predicted dehydrogenase
MRRVKAALIGTGFMGKTHAEALRRLGYVDIHAIVSSNPKQAESFGQQLDVNYITDDYKKVLGDPQVDAVHILTPNSMHYQAAKDAMEAGKGVVCEKPLTVTAAQAADLAAVAKKTGAHNAVQHNLRFYPLVQQARAMVAAGEIGEVLSVQGTYSQDWLLYDTDYNWRVEAGLNGPLRAMGDIGSHWFDMIMHVTGLPVTAVMCEMAIFNKTRKKPRGRVETFTGKFANPDDFDEITIDTDDFGMVMIHLGDRGRGVFTVSQMAAGRKNGLTWEVYGTKASVAWNQERPDELWVGHRNSMNQILIKDGSLMHPSAASAADYPGGHSEGYDDSHKQLLKRFYRRLVDPSLPVDYPTFEDGFRVMNLLEKSLESHQKRAWVNI